MHGIARRIAVKNLGEALIERDSITGWTARHVGVCERIEQRAIDGLELGQLTDQPALLGLESCARVMCDEPGKGLVTVLADIPRTIEGMEAGQDEGRRVAEVVRPGGG